jgi:5-(carboxyamino)imidazole ribonucleotide synthase
VVAIRPGSEALRYTQDKLAMRDRLTELGIPCPRYAPVRELAEVTKFGYPVVLKAVSGGYDGKGVWLCQDEAAAAAVLDYGVPLLAEELVPFSRELAVVAARSPHNQGAVYPVVETVQVDGICREVIAPAPGLDPERAAEAQELALGITQSLNVTGLLAVELFETPGGLLVNELAMRPHNTAHWTIDGARTSQFEQHLRAVLDLPLGSTAATGPAAAMANVLGGTGDEWEIFDRYIHVMAADPGVKIHMYGKEPLPGRKIGHVTVCGTDVADVRDRARRAASYLRWGREDGE